VLRRVFFRFVFFFFFFLIQVYQQTLDKGSTEEGSKSAKKGDEWHKAQNISRSTCEER